MRRVRVLCTVVLIWLLVGAADERGPAGTQPTIVTRLMPEKVYSTRPADAVVDTIMLHFCSDVIANPDNPFNVDRIIEIFTNAPASAHYLIDRDGTIYRLVDEQRVAWHAGKGELPFEPRRKDVLNRHSIGIEMFGIGSQRDMRIFMSKDKYEALIRKHPEYVGFTDAQYRSLDWLIDDIVGRHPEMKRDRYHIVGHDEYAPQRRTDPGETFDWTKIGLTKARPAR